MFVGHWKTFETRVVEGRSPQKIPEIRAALFRCYRKTRFASLKGDGEEVAKPVFLRIDQVTWEN